MSYGGFVIVAVVAFVIPFALGLGPEIALPLAAIEIVAGVALGPNGLGWVELDAPLRVFGDVGLSLLLFLAGLELRLDLLRGAVLRRSSVGFLLSLGLALVLGYLFDLAGLIEDPLLVAIILVATSLGVIIAPLKDGGHTGSAFGQHVIAGASIAEVGSIVLLSVFFSQERIGPETELLLFGLFVVLAVALAVGVVQAGRVHRLGAVVARMQDTSAQLRVRAALALVAVAVWLGAGFGLESILGAFTAGVILGLVEREDPVARAKLEAVGFGVFIPVFFLVSGLTLDVGALAESPGDALLVPLFLVALLVVRAVPAMLYAPALARPEWMAAGLLQATSLTFVVAATHIGQRLGILDAGTATALVGAGLLSVLAFPGTAMLLVRRHRLAAAVREPLARLTSATATRQDR